MFRRRIPRPWAVLGAGLVLVASLTACVEDSAERITSIYELKAVPSEANLNRIRSLLDDPDRDVRATALNALVTLEVPDSARLARAGLEDADAFVRATAAKLLGDVGDRAQVEPLVSRLLEDPDPIVRQRAAESLGRLGGEAAASGLARGLEDPVGSVRLAAVRGVRALDPGMALPALARLLLEDPDWEVRVQAARALGSLGDPEVAPVLEAALADANEFVSSAALNALRAHKAILEGGAKEKAAPGSDPEGGDS